MPSGLSHGFVNPPLPASVSLIGSVDTELPAAATIADGAANPSTPLIGSLGHIFNGTTWDRRRHTFSQSTTGITANSSGTAVSLITSPKSKFAIQAKEQGDTSTFDVRLEGSIDNSNWTQLGAVTNVSPGDAKIGFVVDVPCLYVRYRVAGITRVTGTLDIILAAFD
jgi:hypothetical protein